MLDLISYLKMGNGYTFNKLNYGFNLDYPYRQKITDTSYIYQQEPVGPL